MSRPLVPLLPVIAAIDVGTNAVRLEIARVHPDGSLETLHQERAQVRPGEGTFTRGLMPKEVADRLLSTLRRYGALCRRYKAQVHAVATSAVREAKNRAEIVARARSEAGLDLHVISGREEARIICAGVLHERPKNARSLVIDIGGGSTEIANAVGDRALNLYSVTLGAVRLTEVFGTSEGKVGKKKLRLVRDFAAEAIARGVPKGALPRFKTALGSSGTINAVVAFAADDDEYPKVSARRLSRAVEALAEMSSDERMEHFDPRRAEIVVAGAVVLEQVVEHLGLDAVVAVDRGLRHGILFEQVKRIRSAADDHTLGDAALALAQRFVVDVDHAQQVAKLALALFDDLAALHRLPASARPLLEAAALLHDVGHAVSYQRHHKHSYYLIRNADLPGVAEREKELVALIARYHRRGEPDSNNADVDALTASEFSQLRKLTALLRIADSLDRGHHQTVARLRAGVVDGRVRIRLESRAPLDLELWDAEHEAPLFRRVFGRRVELSARRVRG